MNPTKEQLERLPKWAKEYFLSLERHILLQVETIQELKRSKGGPSRVNIMHYSERIPLSETAVIRFSVGRGDYSYIEATLKDNGIELRGSSRLAVMPRVSNGVDVELLGY